MPYEKVVKPAQPGEADFIGHLQAARTDEPRPCQVSPEDAERVEALINLGKIAKVVETLNEDTGKYEVTGIEGDPEWPIFLGYPYVSQAPAFVVPLLFVREDKKSHCSVFVRANVEPSQAETASGEQPTGQGQPESAPVSALAGWTMDQLKEEATNLGIPFKPVGTSRDSLIKAIEAKRAETASSEQPTGE